MLAESGSDSTPGIEYREGYIVRCPGKDLHGTAVDVIVNVARKVVELVEAITGRRCCTRHRY